MTSSPKRGGYIVVGSYGPPCPRCFQATQIREHREDHVTWRKSYYRRWYCCTNRECKTTLIMPSEFLIVVSQPDPKPAGLSVVCDRDGQFFAERDGERAAGPFASNAEAWRWIDRHEGEPISRSEKVTE